MLTKKLNCLAGLLVAATLVGPTDMRAESEYPKGTLKIVVPFPAGGPLDAAARVLASTFENDLKRVVVVENRPGANGNIGSDFVAKSTPDGRTLLWVLSNTLTANPSLYKNIPFDSETDLIPVGIGVTFDQMLTVIPSLPVNSVAEFVKHAKAQKEKPITYATGGGVGSPGHLTMEYLRTFAAFPATQVPYKGAAPAMTDLLAGVVQTGFMVTSGALPHVKAGRLKGLAVSGSSRSAMAPDIPTIREAGYPDFEVESGFVLLVPKNTPKNILTRLEAALRSSLNSKDVQARIRALGMEPGKIFGAEAQAALKTERAKWQKVIAAAGIDPF